MLHIGSGVLRVKLERIALRVIGGDVDIDVSCHLNTFASGENLGLAVICQSKAGFVECHLESWCDL